MPGRDYMITGRKTCPKCGVDMPLSEFRKLRNHGGKLYFSYCNSCHRESCRSSRLRNPNMVRESSRRQYAKHSEAINARGRARNARIRDEVYSAYGDACACCGETNRAFFTIDHIDGSGADHKREIGRGSLYPWLRRNGFPKDNFQILCFNCNCAKGFREVCPHEIARYELPFAVNVPQEEFA